LESAALTIGLDAEDDERPGAPPLVPRLVRWGLVVGEFGAVQVAVQAVGALAGFIIVRSLAKPEYALYAVANAGLSMFNILADTGITSAMRSIGGEVHGDRSAYSRLVATVRQLRTLFAVFAFAISISFTAWMLVSNEATVGQTILLCIVVLAASWPLVTATIFREAALMLGNYRKVQAADFAGAFLRLSCVAAAFAWLSAAAAMIFAGLANWIQWAIYRRRLQEEIEPAAEPDEGYRQGVLGIARRVLPNTLFYCFQGQLMYVLLTLFGTTHDVADVAALSRLAALLAIFSVVFNNLLAPWFARRESSLRLSGLYAGLLALVAVSLTPFAVFAWFFPQPLLWILGSAYGGLEHEAFLVVVAACLQQFGGAMLWLNHCRAWVHWYSIANIPAILVAQVGSIAFLDLSSVRGVLWFGIVSAIAPMPVYLLDAWRGLRRAAGTRPAASNE
jgi:O-antigen/teichoic acid export membrane protein